MPAEGDIAFRRLAMSVANPSARFAPGDDSSSNLVFDSSRAWDKREDFRSFPENNGFYFEATVLFRRTIIDPFQPMPGLLLVGTNTKQLGFGAKRLNTSLLQDRSGGSPLAKRKFAPVGWR